MTDAASAGHGGGDARADDAAPATPPTRRHTFKSRTQYAVLELAFARNPQPTASELDGIARKLNLPLPDALRWFRNRRHRARPAGRPRGALATPGVTPAESAEAAAGSESHGAGSGPADAAPARRRPAALPANRRGPLVSDVEIAWELLCNVFCNVHPQPREAGTRETVDPDMLDGLRRLLQAHEAYRTALSMTDVAYASPTTPWAVPRPSHGAAARDTAAFSLGQHAVAGPAVPNPASGTPLQRPVPHRPAALAAPRPVTMPMHQPAATVGGWAAWSPEDAYYTPAPYHHYAGPFRGPTVGNTSGEAAEGTTSN